MGGERQDNQLSIAMMNYCLYLFLRDDDQALNSDPSPMCQASSSIFVRGIKAYNSEPWGMGL